MQVSNTHKFQIGDIISFTSQPIVLEEPMRTISGTNNPFPIVTTHFIDGHTALQSYRIVDISVGGSEVIPNRRYTARSHLPEGHLIHAVQVEPFPKTDEYTSPNWFLNTTHMAVSQNVDALPLHYITKLLLFSSNKKVVSENKVGTQCTCTECAIRFVHMVKSRQRPIKAASRAPTKPANNEPVSVIVAKRIRQKYDYAINEGKFSSHVPLNEAYEHDGFDTDDEIDTQSVFHRRDMLRTKIFNATDDLSSQERKELNQINSHLD